MGLGGRVLLQEPEFSDNQRRPGDWEEECQIVKDDGIHTKDSLKSVVISILPSWAHNFDFFYLMIGFHGLFVNW